MTLRPRATEVPELVRRLGSRQPRQVDRARARLSIIGPHSVVALVEALEGDNNRVRSHAMPLLALIQDPRGREALVAMLLDRDPRMREIAARCLARFSSLECRRRARAAPEARARSRGSHHGRPRAARALRVGTGPGDPPHPRGAARTPRKTPRSAWPHGAAAPPAPDGAARPPPATAPGRQSKRSSDEPPKSRTRTRPRRRGTDPRSTARCGTSPLTTTRSGTRRFTGWRCRSRALPRRSSPRCAAAPATRSTARGRAWRSRRWVRAAFAGSPMPWTRWTSRSPCKFSSRSREPSARSLSSIA